MKNTLEFKFAKLVFRIRENGFFYGTWLWLTTPNFPEITDESLVVIRFNDEQNNYIISSDLSISQALEHFFVLDKSKVQTVVYKNTKSDQLDIGEFFYN